MSAQMLRRVFVAAVVMAISLLPRASALADITYSWSGHLRLFDEEEIDPWLIGEDGAEFKLQTRVSGAAVDMNSTQIPFAEFAVTASRLWVDGDEAAFVGDAHIDFTDTLEDFDLVTAGGTFSKNGQLVEISSVVGLDAASFSFHVASESPPAFASTNAAISGTVVHRPYVARVSPGAFVSVIPEPASLVLIFTGFAHAYLLLERRFRRVFDRRNGNGNVAGQARCAGWMCGMSFFIESGGSAISPSLRRCQLCRP